MSRHPQPISTPFGAVLTETGIKFEHPHAVQSHLRGRFGIGELFLVRFAEFQSIRSLKANNYLWGVVYHMLEEETGQKADDIHDAMCALFLPNEHKRVEFFNRLTGENLQVDVDQRRTSRLSGQPFYLFVEDVRQWAREFLQVETPDPDPEYWRRRGKSSEAA